MSKSQIAGAIAEKAGLKKKQGTEILEYLAQLAYKNAKNTFTLPGIGKLVLVNRKARLGRNPNPRQDRGTGMSQGRSAGVPLSDDASRLQTSAPCDAKTPTRLRQNGTRSPGPRLVIIVLMPWRHTTTSRSTQ